MTAYLSEADDFDGSENSRLFTLSRRVTSRFKSIWASPQEDYDISVSRCDFPHEIGDPTAVLAQNQPSTQGPGRSLCAPSTMLLSPRMAKSAIVLGELEMLTGRLELKGS